MGYTNKKKTLYATEQEPPQCDGASESMGSWTKTRLTHHIWDFWMKAVSTQIWFAGMAEHYLPTVQDHAPLRTPTATTILACVIQNGTTTHNCYPGGTTGDRFVSYLKQTLLPTFHRDDIVVMDNLCSPPVQTVKIQPQVKVADQPFVFINKLPLRACMLLDGKH